MRQPLIAGNWKMFKTVQETVLHVKELRGLVARVRGVDVVVAPPFTALYAAAEAARNTDIIVAAQNMHWEREGAFTGEVSAAMIREAGAEYVIVGHSERRTLFGETDQMVNQKIIAALGVQLMVIACVGETIAERDAGQTLDVLDRQLERGLDGLTAAQLEGVVLAYEPVWAIGTGRNATPEQAQDAHAHIRSRIRRWFGVERAEQCRILYGGSVKPQNAATLLVQPDVDGALVGAASLDVRMFMEIVNQAV
jgi:triosephosphate isomerase (TIM)